MDIEDRDHFKTIASASVVPLNGSSKRLNEANFNLGKDPAFCLRAAKTLFACYRKDEAHDPEIYCAAVASVLADYQPEIVELATDPRTGVASEFKFLPSVAEVKSFCDAARERQDRLRRYSQSPKSRRVEALPLAKRPNLFVPEGSRSYERMTEMHKKTQGERSHFANHQCSDGETRYGIWVPLNWYEEGKSA